MDARLLAKYDVAAPRYTSYPTVPYWSDAGFSPASWLEKVGQAAAADPEISLYIHLPFCESLCTYCGCNKHITKNHAVEQPYVQALLAEWKQYRQALPSQVILRELHLGGGTPTFFHPDQLRHLLESIFAEVTVPPDAQFSFEAHPWSTTDAHLRTLRTLGFQRISIGVQDFDEDLMTLVNRRQTIGVIERCTHAARDLGYDSVNYDLIFGLPRQTISHIERDAEQVSRLRPDRIAFYSYAHVPWLKRSQCAYSEADLPTGADKRRLYEIGRARFEALGYTEIGMDHFALPSDGLAQALSAGTLYRNFMGYTVAATRLLIGLGASAIGDTGDAFGQNEKTIAGYQQAIGAGQSPVFRGHRLSGEDERLRRHILRLMTQGATDWYAVEDQDDILAEAVARLEPMVADGLVQLQPMRVEVTQDGRAFLRNICMAFDAHYWRRQPQGALFSRSV